MLPVHKKQIQDLTGQSSHPGWLQR